MKMPEELETRLEWKTVEAGEPIQYPYVKKILHETKPCEDCGLLVENRIVDIKRNVRPHPHWKRTCKNCKMNYNPESGKYDLNQTDYANFQRGCTIKDK